MENGNGERRQSYGRLEATVDSLVGAVNRLEETIQEDRKTERQDRKEMWSQINTNRDGISRIKGVGSVLAAVWSAFIGFLFMKVGK